MNSRDEPSSSCSPASRLTICAFTDTSSAETASSQMIRSVPGASAGAIPMRGHRRVRGDSGCRTARPSAGGRVRNQ